MSFQDLMLALLQNRLGAYCRDLTVRENEDLRLQGVQSMLVHFLSVMHHLDGDNTLMQPLLGLMKQPQQYAVCVSLVSVNCFFIVFIDGTCIILL